jgi:hypothetical protein
MDEILLPIPSPDWQLSFENVWGEKKPTRRGIKEGKRLINSDGEQMGKMLLLFWNSKLPCSIPFQNKMKKVLGAGAFFRV